MTATTIVVRVQAKGGKFLADDIGGALVTIRNALTGECLAEGITRGDSGVLGDAYSDNASQRVIVTPGTTPVIHWLAPDAGTTNFTASLDLDGPTLLEFSAYGPLGGLQSAHRVTTSQWVVPGEDQTAGPGFVIELPGLLLQVLEPATHTALTLDPGISLVMALKANVAMMCGCPIIDSKAWLPTDFEVSATVQQVGSSASTVVPLAFNNDNIPSIFLGEYTVTETGNYQVAFSAYQLSTGNTGTGTVTFTASTS